LLFHAQCIIGNGIEANVIEVTVESDVPVSHIEQQNFERKDTSVVSE
jgi:2-keto-3-deoxy-6-phosphogluconate aldolase